MERDGGSDGLRGRNDLGGGVSFDWVTGDPHRYVATDERLANWGNEGRTLIGIIEFHSKPGGEPCAGSVYFEGVSMPPGDQARPKWQLLSLDPLHLEPSIHCVPPHGCGHHGYIRDGAWVPA